MGLLNMSRPRSQNKEKDLIESFHLIWKQKHPVAYKIFKDEVGDAEISLFIYKYLATICREYDELTLADKRILRIFAHFELVDVLMDNKTIEEKHVALAKWENTMLEIVGNNMDEALKIGRTSGETKFRISENPKIEAFKKREESLLKGRIQGAQVQKIYAATTKHLISTMNSDLLKHPSTARWTLDQRAEYVEKKLIDNERRQINGKPYKASTIRLFITGKE